MTAQTQPDVRDVLGPLINAFGEAQWQSGRRVPHRDLDQLFDAIINGAERLRSRTALSDEQIAAAVAVWFDSGDSEIGFAARMRKAIQTAIGDPT